MAPDEYSALPVGQALSPTIALVPPDPELREMLEKLRSEGHPPFHVAGVQLSRDLAAKLREGASPARPGPVMHAVEDIEVASVSGSVPVRRFRPQAGPPVGVIVYFHGGGWVIGGIEESDELCRTLAEATNCDVVSVGYRLAPEFPYPTALDDADAATTWVAESFGSEMPLVLIGDSAGGNLATVVARRFRDRGRGEISMQILVYPVTDHRMQTPSYSEHAEQMLISSADMSWFWDQYVPDLAQRASSDVSPILADDLRGMPPTLLLVAEYDPLRDEVLAYAGRLIEAGVEVTVDRYETMAHGFFPLVGVLEKARSAVRSVALAVQRVTG